MAGGSVAALASTPPLARYCSTCRAEHARHASVARALAAIGLLAGAASALGLPLLWPRAPVWVVMLSAAAVACAPIAGLGSLSRTGALWGSRPRAWSVGSLGVVVERRALAEALASLEPRLWRPLWLPPMVYRFAWWALPASIAAVSAASYSWQHPRLYVLNLGEERFSLSVDGLPTASIEPAFHGGRASAVSVRLPRGEHALEAWDEHGRLLGEARGTLVGGRDHLFAPGGGDECFWLEVTGYGRDATHQLLPLRSATRFYALQTDVDTWFEESPAPPASDRRSTGGTLTALRHSACNRAPASVREHPASVREDASALGP